MSALPAEATPGAPARTGAMREATVALGLLMGSAAALLLLAVWHVLQGAADLDAATVLRAIFRPEDTLEHKIVRHIRLPRVAIGAIAGASFAVSGVLLQSATRNGMASPATLGVNAGAFLAITLAVVFFPAAGLSSTGVAFAGGTLAAALVYLIAGGVRASPVRLILAGIAMSLTMAALTAALLLFHEHETSGLFFWGAGTLLQNDWSGVRHALPRVLAGIAAALLLSRALDVLLLGDDVARGLGQNIQRTRLAALALAVFLAAVPVSIVGSIGFIGLVAPHLVRLCGVRRHALLLPLAALFGATLLIGADVLGRVVAGELQEVPAGVVTAMVGAPFLVLLARRASHARSAVAAGDEAGVWRATALPFPVLAGSLAILAGAALVAGLFVGGVSLKAQTVLEVLQGGGTAFARRVVLDLRMPRILVTALAGAALAASGVLLQSVVRNPLAAPDTMGVTAGAALGALCVIVAIPDAPLSLLPLAAFAGGLAAFALVYLAAWRGGSDPLRLALVGVAVTAFGTAATNLVVVHENVRIAEALTWLSGSAYARGWDDVARLALWPLLLVPLAWVSARALDIHALGGESARGLGLPVERTRLASLLVAVLLASAAVATAGAIGFVGLVAPHAARLLAGARHRRVLVLAVLLGALLVSAADSVGRVVLAPKEIPAGLITSVVGTPYFLWLLWRGAASRAA